MLDILGPQGEIWTRRPGGEAEGHGRGIKRTIESLDVFLSHLNPFEKLVMGIKFK